MRGHCAAQTVSASSAAWNRPQPRYVLHRSADRPAAPGLV